MAAAWSSCSSPTSTAARGAGMLVGGKPYDVRESPVKDLPVGQRPRTVVGRKRWYRGAEQHCPPRICTERSVQMPPRRHLTARRRIRLEQAASRSARAVFDVTAKYGVSWWRVHDALITAAGERSTAAGRPARAGSDPGRLDALDLGGRHWVVVVESGDDQLR